MKNIILTGGSGFIGSHMLMALSRFYPHARIVNVDAGTYAARTPLYLKPPKNLVHEKLDIRDALGVNKLFEKYGGKNHLFTIHMAAESHVCRSITGPRDFATTNVMGTFNLLEAHLNTRCGRFLHVSTDEVYGEREFGWFDEDSPMRPRSPYAASKAASDMFVRAYHETYGLDAITVNMSNNFGPNQHEEKLVPRTIMHILTGKPVVVHGKGDHIRDWLWVGDAVAGILSALSNGSAGESYCLGGQKELRNIDLVKQIAGCIYDLTGNSDYTIVHTKDRPSDDKRYALDCTKAAYRLGWEPHPEDFKTNLIKTVEWYMRGIIAVGGDAHGWDAHR